MSSNNAGWFASDRILPGLARVRGRMATADDRATDVGDAPDASRMGELVLLSDERVPAHVAIIDAPDIDSIADENPGPVVGLVSEVIAAVRNPGIWATPEASPAA